MSTSNTKTSDEWFDEQIKKAKNEERKKVIDYLKEHGFPKQGNWNRLLEQLSD